MSDRTWRARTDSGTIREQQQPFGKEFRALPYPAIRRADGKFGACTKIPIFAVIRRYRIPPAVRPATMNRRKPK
jgi:hypothetical protein